MLKFILLVLFPVVFVCLIFQENKIYFSPSDLEIDSKSHQIFIIGKTANEIRSYSVPDYTFINSTHTKLPPKAIIISGENILAACSHSKGKLLVINKNNLKLKSEIEVGPGACDVVASADFRKAFVANQFSNDISVVDLIKKKETKRIPVLRQPMQIELSKNGRYLFAANFLPAGRADADTVTSEITVIDLLSENPIKNIPLANGSNALRGMCISPDGKYLFVSHNLGRFQVPTTQLEQGWMNTSGLSVINAVTLKFVATVLLDEPEHGAAGSWGINCNSEFLFVAHSGTHDFSKINYQEFIQRVESHPNKSSLAYDLRFLSGIRERIKINGNGPRILKSFEDKLFVANYFTDNISVVGINAPLNTKSIQLNKDSEMDEIRLGEMYFNDAVYCFQGWQSCNGCHPDEARTDGLNWDLLNDGLGNPKNCKSMLLAHKTPPSMITGIRPSAEIAVRAGFTHIQFTNIEENRAAAVDEYLKSLQAIPSPYLIGNKLSKNAKKGKIIFERENCSYCHSGPYFTNLKKYDIGRLTGLDGQNSWDTPTLIEVWRTGPYLHDGRCATMKEVFSIEKHGIENVLSDDEIEMLSEYVLSL